MKTLKVKNEKYSIEEIKRFLSGCRFKNNNSYDSGQMNYALDHAIYIL